MERCFWHLLLSPRLWFYSSRNIVAAGTGPHTGLSDRRIPKKKPCPNRLAALNLSRKLYLGFRDLACWFVDCLFHLCLLVRSVSIVFQSEVWNFSRFLFSNLSPSKNLLRILFLKVFQKFLSLLTKTKCKSFRKKICIISAKNGRFVLRWNLPPKPWWSWINLNTARKNQTWRTSQQNINITFNFECDFLLNSTTASHDQWNRSDYWQ